MTTSRDRCTYRFIPEEWERNYGESSQFNWKNDEDSILDTTDDVLTEENGQLVWQCPHPTVDSDTSRCLFHTPPENRPSGIDAAAEFIGIVNGERDAVDGLGVRPPQFIGATLGQLTFTNEQLGRAEDIVLDMRHAKIEEMKWDFGQVQTEINMSGATIDDGLISENTVFEGSIRANDTEFRGGVGFLDSTFEGRVSVDGAMFEGGILFSETTLERGAHFQSIEVYVDAEFRNAAFDSGAHFGDATFDCHADFSGTTFKSATFSGGEYKQGADFRGSSFAGTAWFEDTTFVSISDDLCAAAFTEAEFEKPAYFSGSSYEGSVTFGGVANFEQAMFDRKADFTGITVTGTTIYDGGANFASATFSGPTNFSTSQFGAGANFYEARFDDEATFREVAFKNRTAFSEATFRSEAKFTDSTFERVDFDNTVFTRDAAFRVNTSQTEPMFQGETDFTGITARRGIDFRPADDGVNESVSVPIFSGELDCTDADLSDSNFTDRHLGDSINLSGVNLSGAALRNANLSGSNLEDAKLEGADLRQAQMNGTYLENTSLTRTQLYGADFTNAALHGALLGDARISDETSFINRGSSSLLVRRLQVLNQLGLEIGKPRTVCYDPRGKPDVDPTEQWTDEGSIQDKNPRSQAAAVYRSLELLARENAASAFASTCVVWQKDMERMQYLANTGNDRQIGMWLLSWLSNLTTRYGESPWRVLLTSIFVVGLGAALYPLVGLEGFSIVESLYYSVSTFTPLMAAKGSPQPEKWVPMTLLMGQALLGVALTALLVAVLDRKITR